MGRSFSSVESAYSFLSRTPRSWTKCRSLRDSPMGSTALWRHGTRRWVLVYEPSFSVCAALGKKKTSVWMSSRPHVAAHHLRGGAPELGRLREGAVSHHEPVELVQGLALQGAIHGAHGGVFPQHEVALHLAVGHVGHGRH